MRHPAVRLVGDGIGICAALQVLRRHSIETATEDAQESTSPRPALVLDEAAVHLICDLFGQKVFRQAHQLRYRRVRWGSQESVIAQPAVSMRSDVLLDAVRCAAGFYAKTCAIDPADCVWTLCGAADRSRTGTGRAFGRRVALTCEVDLPSRLDPSVCMVETSESGWAFLVPLDRHRASLQVTIPSAPTGRAEEAVMKIAATCSAVFRQGADNIASTVSIIPSAPWIGNQLGGDGWLRVGSGAVRFDPLCGDGTAQSLRTGVLAAACTLLAVNGQRSADALTHYDRRLRRTFAAHLQACSQFYGACPFDQGWSAELDAIRNSAPPADAADDMEFALRDGVLTKVERRPVLSS